MSQHKQQNYSCTVPDGSDNLDEDKHKYLESSRSDSGFISGEIVSGDITEEEIVSRQVEYLAESGMRLDSGIVDSISENFSSLNLKNENLNDLSSSKIRTQSPTPVVSNVQKEDSEAVPWMMYYEQDEDGDTHLHLAIVQGFHELALALIRMAPMTLLLDTLNDDKQSPLHLAVIMRQPRVARWLVVAGARPDPRCHNGDSPLHIAARNGDIECCKAIVEPVQPYEREALGLHYPPGSYPKCNLDQWNNNGQTSIHVAAEQGQIEVLKCLLLYGADINAREGLSGYTALHYAISKGNERLAQFLLSECHKLNPGTVSYGGKSVLQINRRVSETLAQVLRSRGVSSSYSSDDSEIDSDDDDRDLDMPMLTQRVQVTEATTALCH